MDETFRRQAVLLLRCLPSVNKQACFALKGGTAINLFVRNMPRLSVDIDLVYLPIESRAKTLANIESNLKKISRDIQKTIKEAKVTPLTHQNRINKLDIRANGVQIKIEPNIVQRGAIYKPEELELCNLAEKEFELSVATTSMAIPELYGSKIAAALDRQHPRDLFDIMHLLRNEGLTNDVRKAFVVYLASHPRPMNELLNPNKKDIKQEFKTQFQGMTTNPVHLKDLLHARDELVTLVNKKLTTKERLFLLSLKMGEPNWALLKIPNIAELPAIQWKIENIQNMSKKKHHEAIEKLKQALKL